MCAIQNFSDEWLARLEANGYRLTAPRRAVVETIAASQLLLTPLDVYDQTRPRYPGLGLVTVYRTIDKLEEMGLQVTRGDDWASVAYRTRPLATRVLVQVWLFIKTSPTWEIGSEAKAE